MAYIDLGMDEEQNPGVTGPLKFRPATGRPLGQFAEALLQAPGSLSPGERELIAAVVSTNNDCTYCSNSHTAFAAKQLEGGHALVAAVKEDLETAPISPRLRALLRVAEATREWKNSQQLVDAARAEGATDVEVHDTVLIAAAFCMFNRYVEGLGTFAPADLSLYDVAAEFIVAGGYGSLVPDPE